MNSYILSLLAAMVAAAWVEHIAPQGEGGRMAAHVRMIAGLFLLVSLLRPVCEGLSLLRDITTDERAVEWLEEYTSTDYESIFQSTLTAISNQEVESWVLTTLDSVFSIPSSGCTVSATCATEDDTPIVVEVRIALHGRYSLQDPHPIESYFGERLSCPCYVTVA